MCTLTLMVTHSDICRHPYPQLHMHITHSGTYSQMHMPTAIHVHVCTYGCRPMFNPHMPEDTHAHHAPCWAERKGGSTIETFSHQLHLLRTPSEGTRLHLAQGISWIITFATQLLAKSGHHPTFSSSCLLQEMSRKVELMKSCLGEPGGGVDTS